MTNWIASGAATGQTTTSRQGNQLSWPLAGMMGNSCIMP